MSCRANHLLPLLTLFLACGVLVSGQSTAGFINIDCGKPKDYTYNDSTPELLYTSDFQYIDAGEIHRIAPTGTTGYYTQSYDLRSFPNGTRNCYSVKPVDKGRKYLVRASFMYGNYDGKNELPQFDLYLGIHFWDTITLVNQSINYFSEILSVASSDQMSVCLINTGSGTPFMSALELRPLPDDLYTQVDSSQALSFLSRIDFGQAENTIRYPSDPYDRFWLAYSGPGWIRLSTPLSVSGTIGYEPPSDVMNTASSVSPGSILNVSWSLSAERLLKHPQFHIFFHFSELQKLKTNETRIFNITLNGEPFSNLVNPTYLKPTTIFTENPIKYTKLSFSLVSSSPSMLPPIINAGELYEIRDTKVPETDRGDVNAVMEIKASYELQKSWMGDPCLPSKFIWDGVNCSYEGSAGPRIVSLNLSSSGLSGEIATSFSMLTRLQSLDLSGNNLTGGVPDVLTNLTLLRFLDLSGNELNGYVPKTLLDQSDAGTLTLRYGNRDWCNDTNNCEDAKKKNSNKTRIAVSVTIVSIIVSVAGLLILVFVFKKRTHPGNLQSDMNSGKQMKNSSSFRMPSFHSENLQFTVDDLAKITDNFSKEIGRGGFGPVYYGVLGNNAEVAVKMLSKSSDQGPREFQAEAQLLTRIHHRNLVSLVGYCNQTSSLALVYEYMAEGSVHDHLSGKTENPLSWVERLQISVDAAQGLEYLHVGCKPTIIHRDVKTNNILLNRSLEAKISDFGLSRFFQNDMYSHIHTVAVGTPGYVDPEYYMTNKLNEKSDVYSFGVVLLELITGLPAIVSGGTTENMSLAHWAFQRFERGEIDEIIDNRIRRDCDINSAWKAAETAMACVAPVAIQRPTMSDVLMLLRECLEIQTAGARNKNPRPVSKNTTMEIPSMDANMLSHPSAR